MNTSSWFFLALVAFFLAPLSKTWAVGECEPWVARVVSVEGRVEAKRAGHVLWEPVAFKETFCAEDTIRVEAHGRAAIVLRNETILRLDQGTAITFSEIDEQESSWLDLIKGAVHFLSRVPRTLKIRTAFVNAAIEGTEFAIRVDPQQVTVWVLEGRVLASNKAGSLTLMSGEAAIAKAGQAPVPHIVVRPRDAVQWALYYPPIIDYRAAAYPPDPGVPSIQEALARYQVGDLQGAFARLEIVPAELRDARYYTIRAGLLLSVGRVDEARSDIEQILNIAPDNADAFALQAIIALVQTEKDKALALAQRAAELAPQSPIPQVALSYVYQARFDIDKALDTAQEAVNLDPANALAWARLAELWLAVGNLDRALKAAQEAVMRNPDLARTQTMLGFAYLTRIETKQARAAFEKAIVLDQADPLPRLGLGLAKIRKSNLHEGRREIEIAASLDPNHSIIRSYLGKAYFEERRDPLAAEQFAIAKELDPLDPTPWFYDAIRKQLRNRPVQALDDLEQSIALNDNRAVYRSRLLLDQDLAARSASLGQIYRDLGFEQLALLEGWKSVNTDPTNHSAHRFLADSYSALRRHEIARVSELLQSQLLQPINITPLQPRLAASNLLILEGAGPADPSFNEFNPLFARNRLALQASGIIGSNNTFGDEITQSGLWQRFSYSLGQFHFETDGFRDNNDLQHDIYNAFAQVSLSPAASLQIELRRQETESGDLRLRFEPEAFSPTRRLNIERDSARLGFRLSPKPHEDVIASIIYSDRQFRRKERLFEITIDENEFFFQDTLDFEAIADSQTFHAELQYLLRMKWLDFIIGAGHADQDRIDKDIFTETEIFLPFSPDPEITKDIDSDDLDTRHTNAYLYSNVRFFKNLTWTVGVTFDSFKDPIVDRDQLNPKLGLIWQLLPSTTLRAAAFSTVKRLIAANQTIEPTQVAGFNQFFDDIDGAKTKRYGIALEQTFSSHLFSGLEFSWRDLEIPVFQKDEEGNIMSIREEQDEQFHRIYVYWTPTNSFALSTEYFFEMFDRVLTEFSNENEPVEITTHRIPLTINHYQPNGFFAKFKGTYVNQEIDFFGNRGTEDSQFWVVDTSLGYRLPNRWGIASVGVKNLFDEKFRFQDINFQTGDPRIPLFQPERTFFARLTLSF